MDSRKDELFGEALGAWTLSYSRAPFDGVDAGDAPTAVELSRDGRMHVRLVLTRPGLTTVEATGILRERARAWIADFDSREHSGDTDWPADDD